MKKTLRTVCILMSVLFFVASIQSADAMHQSLVSNCPVCFESPRVGLGADRYFSCEGTHDLFCRSCLADCAAPGKTCPLCRAPLRALPIHDAVQAEDIASLVLQARDLRRNVNERDVQGRTPLFLAGQAGNAKAMMALFALGANPAITNANGATIFNPAPSVIDRLCIRGSSVGRDVARYARRNVIMPTQLLWRAGWRGRALMALTVAMPIITRMPTSAYSSVREAIKLTVRGFLIGASFGIVQAFILRGDPTIACINNQIRYGIAPLLVVGGLMHRVLSEDAVTVYTVAVLCIQLGLWANARRIHTNLAYEQLADDIEFAQRLPVQRIAPVLAEIDALAGEARAARIQEAQEAMPSIRQFVLEEPGSLAGMIEQLGGMAPAEREYRLRIAERTVPVQAAIIRELVSRQP